MWSLACELIVAGRQRIHRATAEVASEPEALSPIAGCAKGVSVFSHRSHLKRSVLMRAALTATIANERASRRRALISVFLSTRRLPRRNRGNLSSRRP